MTATALVPTSGWTPERRRRAAERIRTHKPWRKATGPKTVVGKSASRMNALKHGRRSVAEIEKHHEVLRFLRDQAHFLRQVRLMLRLRRQIKKITKPTNEMIADGNIIYIERLTAPLSSPVLSSDFRRDDGEWNGNSPFPET